MLRFLEKAYDKIRDIYGPKHFSALLVLLVVISIVGFIIGVRQMKYIRKDPAYCNSCHLMKETFDEWSNSSHKTVTCQHCHRLGVLEQNALLVKHILYGERKTDQKHGKKLPWESCGPCHWVQESQGGDVPEKLYGHYRHNFLACFNCHPISGHSFPPDISSCEKCHKDKDVHGSGMRGLSCMDCHIFSLREGTEKNRVIPTRQRCKGCHDTAHPGSFPPAAPMSGLECFDCHDPHAEITPDDSVCMGCHVKDVQDEGHSLHRLTCASCHKAHLWKTATDDGLCGSCHAERDPEALFPSQ